MRAALEDGGERAAVEVTRWTNGRIWRDSFLAVKMKVDKI